MKFLRAVRHITFGIEYRYPLCCIAQFTWDGLCGRDAGMERPGFDGFVPCRFHTKFGGRR